MKNKRDILKFALQQLVAKFGSEETDKGTLFYEEDGDPQEGYKVSILEGEDYVQAPDGVYETNAKSITVEAGIIVSIVDKNTDEIEMEVADEEIPEPAVEEEVSAEYVTVETFNELVDKFNTLLQAFNALNGIVEEVEDKVDGVSEEFSKSKVTPVSKSAKQEAEVVNNKPVGFRDEKRNKLMNKLK